MIIDPCLEVALVDVEVAAGLVVVLDVVGHLPPVVVLVLVVRRLCDGGRVVLLVLDWRGREAPGDRECMSYIFWDSDFEML